MNHTSYTKTIPPFFQKLLGQINKINIWSLNSPIAPHQTIHYQPYKSGINIYTSAVIKLSHEMSHMLEVRDNNKLVQFDYGIRKYFPTTHKGQLQAMAREARTRGIQTRMVEVAFGNSQLLYQRYAYLIVKPANQGIGKFNTNEEIVDWCSTITSTAYNEWSREKIVEIWKQKAEFINNWLETDTSSLNHDAHLDRYKRNEQWFAT